MSTEIYYFSGTGNSMHVARELQKRMPGTEIIPIVSLLDRDRIKIKAQAAGLLFPLYATRMPAMVKKFVTKIDFSSAGYIFAVTTRGGTDCRAFAEIDRLLKKRGRRLDSFFVIDMPSGSTPLLQEYTEIMTPEKLESLESKMLERMDSIAATITGRLADRSENMKGNAPPPDFLVPFMPLIKLLGPMLLPLGKLAERRFVFYFDAKCNGCGLCERVCPAQKIKMVDGKPLWLKEIRCFGCFACLNYCPLRSVQVKSSWYLKSYTPQNGRYHHPAVMAGDIAGQKGYPARKEPE